MKFNRVLEALFIITCMAFLLLGCTGETKKTQQVTVSNDIDIRFLELWPYYTGTIRFEKSPDGKMVGLNGEGDNTFGFVCMQKKVPLNGKRTLEVEVLDLGSSSFNNNKMLKISIWNIPNGNEIPLICKDPMMRSSDPQFVLPLIGKFRYSLDSIIDDAIYKLDFTFYNATIKGIKIRARFTD